MAADSPSTIEKTFALDEFTELLAQAAAFAVARCRTEYCDPAPPEEFSFVLRPQGESSDRLVSTTEVVRELLREDGSFREWINLSPVAVAGSATVLEVDYPDRFTKRLIVGPLALRFEPFHVLGPALPSDWVEGTPIPKVSLPPLRRAAG